MSTLFLLTKTYPFGNGEQYITNELPYLANVFDKVIIYPNDYYSNNTAHNKKLPNNIEVLNFNQQLKGEHKNTIADYWYLIKNTITECIETDDKKYFFKNFKWNLINFWTQYQISKSFNVYLKESNYNLTNTVFYSYWFHKSAILLGILKDKKHIHQFISRAHSIDLYHNHWGIISNEAKVPPFKMFKLKHCSSILTISHHGAEFIKNNYPKYSNKTKPLLLGINLPQQNNITHNPNHFLIVTCSHLDNCKRLDLLAEALINIKHSVKWVHFGGGDIAEEKKIMRYVQYFQVNITFELMGYVSNTEVHQFYKNNRIDLFVNLSKVEGIPVSIMEAMSYSIPLLATRIYGVPEAVIENENGFLLDVNFTQQQLIDTLNYCIEHKELLQQYGENSYKIYSQKFDANKNYTQFASVLKLNFTTKDTKQAQSLQRL